jgi:hypothetical protein
MKSTPHTKATRPQWARARKQAERHRSRRNVTDRHTLTTLLGCRKEAGR